MKAKFELYRSLDEDTEGELIAKKIQYYYTKKEGKVENKDHAKLPRQAEWPEYRNCHKFSIIGIRLICDHFSENYIW